MEENQRLQQLIESKTFNELTNEERTMVLKEISEEEYSLRRSVLEGIRVLLGHTEEDLEPDPEVKNKAALLFANKARKKEKSILHAVFAYKVPLFIPAAAAVLLLFMLPFVFENPTKREYVAQVTDTVQKVVYKTDTVVKEIEVIKPVVTIKYVYKEKPKDDLNVSINQAQDRIVKTDPAIMLEKTQSQLKHQSAQSGKSSGDTRELGFMIKRRDTLINIP